LSGSIEPTLGSWASATAGASAHPITAHAINIIRPFSLFIVESSDAQYTAGRREAAIKVSHSAGTLNGHERPRGHRPPDQRRWTGASVVNGSYVTLADWRHLILKRAGDTLFGLTIDPGTGRTLSVQLERVP